MRNIFWSVLVLIAVLFIFGCEKGSSFIPLCVNEKDTMLLKIYRCRAFRYNPYIVILAKKVNLNYEQRTIVVEELKNFTGDDSWTDGYDWILPEIKIEDGNLIINIPKDNSYYVYIGENQFYLPRLNK